MRGLAIGYLMHDVAMRRNGADVTNHGFHYNAAIWKLDT